MARAKLQQRNRGLQCRTLNVGYIQHAVTLDPMRDQRTHSLIILPIYFVNSPKGPNVEQLFQNFEEKICWCCF